MPVKQFWILKINTNTADTKKGILSIVAQIPLDILVGREGIEPSTYLIKSQI